MLDGAHETLAMTQRVAIETHGPEQHEGVLKRLRAAGFATEQVVREGATGMVRAIREVPQSSPITVEPAAEAVAWHDRSTPLSSTREPSTPARISNGNASPRTGRGDSTGGETCPGVDAST